MDWLNTQTASENSVFKIPDETPHIPLVLLKLSVLSNGESSVKGIFRCDALSPPMGLITFPSSMLCFPSAKGGVHGGNGEPTVLGRIMVAGSESVNKNNSNRQQQQNYT